MKIMTIAIAILMLSAIVAPLALASNDDTNVNYETAKPYLIPGNALEQKPEIQNLNTNTDTAETIVSSDVLTETEITIDSVDDLLEEVQADDGWKRFGASKIWTAFGSMNNGEQGYLINGFWLSQEFADVLSTSDKAIESRKTKARGHLKIVGYNKNLFIVRTDGDNSNDNVRNFDIISNARSDTALAKNSDEYKIGVLVLEKDHEYRGLTTWNGKMLIESGDLKGTWYVDLNTSLRNIRKSGITTDQVSGNTGESGSGANDIAITAEKIQKQSGEKKGLAKIFSRIFGTDTTYSDNQ